VQETPQGASENPPVRVIVVQDHPMLASAIARILECEPDLTVCAIAGTGAEASVEALGGNADVVLMDFRLPDMSGPAAAALIRAQFPAVAVVFHSAEDSEWALLDAINVGAAAYLTKSATADELVEAVRRAGKGEVLIPASLFAKAIAHQRRVNSDQRDRKHLNAQFTARELDVLNLLAEGLDTTAMSNRLSITPHTIEWHVRHLIEKLDVHSKLQAVIAAARLGLIDVTTP
jgi:DNA-binding NarL/FixJ family response regulator